MNITHSECVSIALVIQLAKCMRHIVICCHPPGSTIFPTLSHKRHDFRKRFIEYKMHVLIFSTTFFQRRIQQDAIIDAHRSSCEVPIILVRC